MEEQSGADLSGLALFIVSMQSLHTVLNEPQSPSLPCVLLFIMCAMIDYKKQQSNHMEAEAQSIPHHRHLCVS